MEGGRWKDVEGVPESLPKCPFEEFAYGSETLEFFRHQHLDKIEQKHGFFFQSKVYIDQLLQHEVEAMDRNAGIFDWQDHLKSAGLGFDHIITSCQGVQKHN